MEEATNELGKTPVMTGPEPSGLERRLTNITNKVFSIPVRIMVNLGSLIILAMILLMDSDVIGRYVFKHPIQGADELIGFLFLCLAACSFSYTQKEKKHIRIELLIERIPLKARQGFDLLAYLITLTMAILISRQLFIAAQKFILNKQSGSSVTEILGIPWSPFLIILGIGFTIFALVSLTDVIIATIKLVKR